MRLRLVAAAACVVVCAVSLPAAGGADARSDSPGGAKFAPPDKLPASLTLPQAVRLVDGSVLPAGRFDVQIHYKGFGNAAEFWFFQGGALKGKVPAEARGFPSAAPASAPVGVFPKVEDKLVKLTPADKKAYDGQGAPLQGVKTEDPPIKGEGKVLPAAARASFSWGAYGFNPGLTGKTVPSGRRLRLAFDSANGPAGFNAILPFVERQAK